MEEFLFFFHCVDSVNVCTIFDAFIFKWIFNADYIYQKRMPSVNKYILINIIKYITPINIKTGLFKCEMITGLNV